MGRRSGPVGPTKLYTVYNDHTDEPVALCEPARRAAQLMGITEGSFRSAASRQGTKGNRKWHIESVKRKDLEDGETDE